MLARARTLQARLFPHGVLDGVRQFLIFAGAYYGYSLIRGVADGRPEQAFQNGRHVIDLERSLHIFVEPAVQAWTGGWDVAMDFASWIYINAQTTIVLAALVFIYLFHNERFYFVRNMFMVAMGLALVGYVVYPTAPPRMLPELGFVDSVSDFTGVSSDSNVNALFNPYAAVPSMHVGFALMLAVPMIRMARYRATKIVWALYAPVVTAVVVLTANHWIFDAATGALVAAISALAAQTVFARVRPTAWAWDPEPDALPAPARAG